MLLQVERVIGLQRTLRDRQEKSTEETLSISEVESSFLLERRFVNSEELLWL